MYLKDRKIQNHNDTIKQMNKSRSTNTVKSSNLENLSINEKFKVKVHTDLIELENPNMKKSFSTSKKLFLNQYFQRIAHYIRKLKVVEFCKNT